MEPLAKLFDKWPIFRPKSTEYVPIALTELAARAEEDEDVSSEEIFEEGKVPRRDWTVFRRGRTLIGIILVLGIMTILSVVFLTRSRWQHQCAADVYKQKGYIWRSGEDIRWVPYSDPTRLLPPSPIHIYNSTILPTPYDLSFAPPSYTNLLSSPSRATDPALSFSQNKTIVVIGDSHSRRQLEGLCQRLGPENATLNIEGGHNKGYCYIPDLGLRFVLLFHFGIARTEETWYFNEDGSTGVEERIEGTLVPYLEELRIDGAPDFVLLQSGYWLYQQLKPSGDEVKDLNLQKEARPLTWAELTYHRQRMSEVVDSLRSRWGKSLPLMLRTTQEHQNGRDMGNVGIYQLNESLEALADLIKVPIMPWTNLITGTIDYSDDQHLAIGSEANAIWIDMVLYYLARSLHGCLL
ncbi:hypothetical protein BDP27DRAFT_1311044 [Rhodocollybia butyracea]|uniref:Uncharacterized protein n=1 Tax=Rhodocollybia butyracea TaxID=206335 RepID=A0A9P5QBT4_9AGAR|nr:hypothetical protein BDP27DRAFT_1311044 [Rhodocollybia butyracea]